MKKITSQNRMLLGLGVLSTIIISFSLFSMKESPNSSQPHLLPKEDSEANRETVRAQRTTSRQVEKELGDIRNEENKDVSMHLASEEEESSLSKNRSLSSKKKQIERQVSSVLNRFNMLNGHLTRLQVAELASLDARMTAEILVSHFKRVGSVNGSERDAIITLSKSLDSPYLEPLWTDVLERRTQRFEREAEKMIPGPHRNMIYSVVRSEQNIAIRELGQIMQKSPKAAQTLWKVIKNENQEPYDLKLRIRAFRIVSERDSSALLKLAQSLPLEDELRNWLKKTL